MNHSGQDRLIWGWDPIGDFSVKSTYEGRLEFDSLPVWSWKFCFLELSSIAKSSCPQCEGGLENVDNLFQGCRDSIAVWEAVFRSVSSSNLFSSNFDD
ncbi:hypothetical protein ACOSP7_020903 [Xanthoceras sorbifolium]